MPAPLIFFDIAGTDSQQLADFYARVFDWDISPEGRFAVPVKARLNAAIRCDPADKLLYFGVSDVAATLALIERLGGSVTAPRFEVAGMVVLGLFADPAGNHMGLVELEGAEIKVP